MNPPQIQSLWINNKTRFIYIVTGIKGVYTDGDKPKQSVLATSLKGGAESESTLKYFLENYTPVENNEQYTI